jgi:2-oxoglutarate ferredoxin oxidoreductase subunit alpha
MPGGQYVMSGIEHNENGAPCDRPSMHDRMNEKRFKKLEFIREEINYCRSYGPKDAEVGVIAWGSSKGVLKEAVLNLETAGHKVRGFVPQVLYPLSFEKFENFLKPLRKLVVVEMSYTAQFLKYLKSHFDIPCEQIPLKRSGGMPFTVSEIQTVLLEAIQHDRPVSDQQRELEAITAY